MDGRRYRPEIDGLRAVAVLAVLVYHAAPALLPAGFVGVDIFFVISGYLITSILVAEHGATGRIDLLAFYARRARRLLPALVVVIVATMGLAWMLVPTGPYVHDALESAGAALLFSGNIYFQLNSGGYFDGPANTLPLLHLWSLGVEEQFYLVYPLVLLGGLRFGRRGAAWVLLLLALASLSFAEYAMGRWPDAAFYQMPARLWELAAGALVALPGHRVRSPWLAALGLALIAYSVFWTPERAPGLGVMLPVLGAALFLLPVHGGLSVPWPRPMVTIGKWSYSAYLWHWPLLALDRASAFGEPPAWRLLAWCALAIVLAGISHRFLEVPAMASLATRPSGKVLRLAAGTVAVALVTGTGAHMLHRPATGAAEIASKAQQDRPPFESDCHFPMTAEVRNLLGCRSGESRPTVAIWGDSHALAWSPFAWSLAGHRGTSATLLSMDACPPLVGLSAFRADAPTHMNNCARLNHLALKELPAFDTVIVAARWLGYMAPGASPPAAEFDNALSAALGRLDGVREVLVILPAFELPETAPKCILTQRESRCGQTREEAEAARAAAVRRLQAIAAKHRNVTLVDPLPYFCTEDCPVRKGDMALFWDDDHVSSSAARGFAAAFIAERREL